MTITATIKTSKGDIHLNLFPEEAPLTVSNFVNLAKRGYYNGLNFHRVIKTPPFMIQGGCPDGIGSGGPGYKFKDECHEKRLHDKGGILSMANAGPNTNGSQFFITHVPTPWLNGRHTVFGEVDTKVDLDVVNKIEQGDKIIEVTVGGDVDSLLATNKKAVDDWNKILDR